MEKEKKLHHAGAGIGKNRIESVKRVAAILQEPNEMLAGEQCVCVIDAMDGPMWIWTPI